ncbi:MAG: hypothetical protein ABWZ66_00145 [Pyrinomonadaceae bacterium]
MNGFTAQRFGLFVLFVLALACTADAQDKTQADENFALNITDERITETNYERSTEVEVGDDKTGVSVRVGASVSAQTITLTLRGITGNVRFRASLDKIRTRIQD